MSELIYTCCHTVGVWVLWLCSVLSYGIHYAFDAVYELFDSLYERLLDGRGHNFGNLSLSRSLFNAGHAVGQAAADTHRTFRTRGASAGIRKIFLDIGHFFRHLWRTLAPVLNVAAPVAAVLLCIRVINVKNDFVYGMQVTFKGETIGVVESESVFSEAKSAISNRVENATGEAYYVTAKPEYRLVTVTDETEFRTAAQVEEAIIAGSPELFRESNGLYINGTLVAVNDYPDAVQKLLDAMLEEAMASYEELNDFSDLSDATVSFVDTVELREGLYPVTGKKTVAEINALLHSVVSDEVTYTIEAGDAPKKIIAKFDNLTLEQLYALNPSLENGKKFVVGKEIIVSTEVPYLQTKLTGVVTYEEETAIPVTYIESNSYYVGVTKTKSEGEAGVNRVTAQVLYINGIKQESTVLETVVVKEAVAKEIYKGTKTGYSLASLKGTYIRPVDGGYISSKYGSRVDPITGKKGAFHSGLDLCVPRNTPIHASASGTIIYMSYMGSYGNLVKIDHGGGYVTYYAHCSSFASGLKVGDKVTVGQTIAYVGTTGRVTGPHCHFEIRYKNETVNINGLFPN